jgi:hypothetical protein
MARLRRVSDGAGDMGGLSQAIAWNEDRTFKGVVGNRPIVGCSMMVGAVTARTYRQQDYWLTTPVTKILEDKGDYVRFETGNSEYEWWAS